MASTVDAAYEDLIRRVKEVSVLGSCAGLLGWDEQTYMPKGGAAHRAEQHALLAGLIHERVVDPAMKALLNQVEDTESVAEAYSVAAVNVREVRRGYDRMVKLPRSLVEELARVTTLAHQAWAEAREKSDFERFRPHLEKVLALKRQEAAALNTGGTAYDTLLDEYEMGETTENLTRVFSALRDELVELVGAIQDSGKHSDVSILQRDYPVADQEAFGKAAAEQIGFNFEAGRLDETVHPFCSGLGPGDTRITTRYDPHFFSQAFFGILHEAGHGLYSQGLDAEHYGTPMGDAVSLGIHESQSRMWENFVGRGQAFWDHFFPKAQKVFPDALRDVSQDDFYRAINHVELSFIRVEADEATYNLHILLRFEMEQALIDGDLPAADVPGMWNEMFEKYFRLQVPDDAQGCLQDIHWSFGGIGYFPTYTLGNLYAAQFFEQAREDLGDLDAQFARGDFSPLKDWLTEKIYRQGMRYPPGKLAEMITGRPLSHVPLVDHLKARFGPLYGIHA